MKEKLLAVVGPTAVGKTKVSIELAKALDGEVINGDAMQVYKGMDIGTAKTTQEEMQGIPHHLFDFKDPDEPYSAAEFQALALPLVTEINERGRLPIVVGGTGLYIKALTHHYHFGKGEADPDFRKEMEHIVATEGADRLYEKLKAIDPESAERIHPNNVRRIIRALEIYHATGVPASQRRKREERSPYILTTVGLTMDRARLYRRIDERVDRMIEEGLLNEVKRLYESGVRDRPSVQAIGYKEIYAYLRGECTMETAIDRLKKNSRRYAKKQYTWFRRQMDVRWFDVDEGLTDKKISEIMHFVAGKYE